MRKLLIILLLAFSLPADVLGRGNQNDQGEILIIASYNPDTKRMSSFISDFEQRILKEKIPFEILVEDLGCKSISEAPVWRARLEEILQRYDQNHLRAVILLGQEAWASFLSLGKFPENLPFFGCYASVNGIRLPSAATQIDNDWQPETVDMIQLADSVGNGGGSLNQYDIARNIDLILSLYPLTKNIAFISDNTYGGISLQALVRQEMKNYPDLTLTLIDTRNGEEQAAQAIARLPKNSALLIGTWRVGREGQYLMYNSIENLVADNPSLPSFSLSGSGIGSVAIGGYIPSYESGAAEIAGQIARYYRDKTPVHFEPTTGEYRFDLKKLKEFEIAEYKLPAGSIVVDSMEVKLKQYQDYILLSIIGIVVLTFFLLFLTYLYLKNKKLKSSLENREVQLIEAKEKAEESDRLKSAFLANMSHEIRTPLNAIVGFSSLMSDQNISPEERAEYNSIISKNSNLMLTLIGDILDISRLETGKTQFVYAREDIYPLCLQVISTTQLNFREGVEAKFEPSQESYMLKTDSQRLSQILINLMTNAAKFTEEGSITLSYQVDEEKKRVIFAVTDTGCGIPPQMQDKVFNRFEKLNEFKQGTGLGLAICKQIALKFGGDIWVDPNYHAGARFILSHPILP